MQDVGLPPPDAAAFQGLTMDLENVADYLGKIPIENIIALSMIDDETSDDDGEGNDSGIPIDAEEEESDRRHIIERQLNGLNIHESIIEKVEREVMQQSSTSSSISMTHDKTHERAPSLHHQADHDEQDAELDELLALGQKQQQQQQTIDAESGKSLEDWLDSL